MSNQRDQLRREECRHAVRAYLYDRSAVAQSADTITRTLRPRGYDYSTDEVAAACSYWVGDGQLEEIRDPAGATRHYRITTAGIRSHEATLV